MTLEVRNIYPLAATFKKVASLYEAAFPVEERLSCCRSSAASPRVATAGTVRGGRRGAAGRVRPQRRCARRVLRHAVLGA